MSKKVYCVCISGTGLNSEEKFFQALYTNFRSAHEHVKALYQRKIEELQLLEACGRGKYWGTEEELTGGKGLRVFRKTEDDKLEDWKFWVKEVDLNSAYRG